MSEFEVRQQEMDQWCWAAVAVAVKNYLFPQEPMTQCQVAQKVVGKNCGCNGDGPSIACDQPESLTKALTDLNLPPKAIPRPLSFTEVKSTIDGGWPIPVRIVWDDNPNNAHFVVISGYAFSQSRVPLLQVDDPFYGRSLVEYDSFVSGYRGIGQWEQTYAI